MTGPHLASRRLSAAEEVRIAALYVGSGGAEPVTALMLGRRFGVSVRQIDKVLNSHGIPRKRRALRVGD